LAHERVDGELGGADGVGDIYVKGFERGGVDVIAAGFEVPEVGERLFHCFFKSE